MIKRHDSLSSNASSLVDDTIRSSALTTAAVTSTKQQLYHDGGDQRKFKKVFHMFSSLRGRQRMIVD
jgi:hypothetical protein